MSDTQEKEASAALESPQVAPRSVLRRMKESFGHLFQAKLASRPSPATLHESVTVTAAQETPEKITDTRPETEPLVEPPIESLVDLKRIPLLLQRRQVWDWRDTTHAQVHAQACALHQNFMRQLDREYEELSFLQRWLTKTAHEALQIHFLREFRWPFLGSLKAHELGLRECAGDSRLFGKFDLLFHQPALAVDCSSLQDLEFTPTHRETIEARVHALVFGRYGCVERTCEQATELAQKVLDRNCHAQQRSL